MKRLVQFPLEDGSIVLVEADEDAPGESASPGPRERDPDAPIRRTFRVPGTNEAEARDALAERAQLTFDQALNTLRPAAESMIARLRGLVDPPDEIGVEFGVKLSARAGAIIASADSEANFKVSLAWKRKEKPAPASNSGDKAGG